VGNLARKILVVDDNEMLLKAWDRMLGERHLNYSNYRLTKQPEQALEWLTETNFDIAIIDVVMPTLDGFDFVRAAWKINPHLKLVFTTAYNCDFQTVSLPLPASDDRDVHVLMKPYLDINKVEDFVTRLVADDRALNDSPPLDSQSDLRFHIWHL